MTIYFVGDIQGCYSELRALLKKVGFNKTNDQLWLAGDLVARGPGSLATLRFVKSLGKQAKGVLGNHDLHLLATYAGIKNVKKNDLLDELLAADDIDELMDWLAQQPLIQKLPNEDVYMSHAGIPPEWDIKTAVQQAEFAHQLLSSEKRNKWLERMYGNLPNTWSQATSKTEQFRYTINALTRMRYCYLDKSLEFDCKKPPEQAPDNIQPWFNLSKVIDSTVWIFGHWAALMGKCSHPNVFALDTGCVWGNHMTLIRWHDKKMFTEPAHKIIDEGTAG